MVAKRQARTIRIVGDASVEDLLVLTTTPGELTALRYRQAVALGGLPQGADQSQQPRGVGGLVEGKVKFRVGNGRRRRIVVGTPLQVYQAPAGGGFVALAEAHRCATNRQ